MDSHGDCDKVFCYLCVGNIDEAFVVRGYSNWKDASGDKGGVEQLRLLKTDLPRTIRDFGEQLS